MRLSTCLAVELGLGLSTAVAIGLGATHGAAYLRHLIPAHEAQAAEQMVATLPKVERVAIPRLEPPPPMAVETGSGSDPADFAGIFDGVHDELLLNPLRDGRVVKAKFNRGGSSISMRLDLENGARAAFKPVQTNLQTVPRREIAAYRLDRLLGIGAVPPAIGRQFPLTELLSAVDEGSRVFLPRLRAEMTAEDGMVAGEVSWWIPVIDRARINGFEIDKTDGIVTWKRYLAIHGEVPSADVSLVRQISTMIAFDFLIDNVDRWSGSNARISEDGSVLYFMDNTLSFSSSPTGHRKSRTYLERVQKFSKSFVKSLRELDEASLRAAVAGDTGPFPYLLSDSEITAVLGRREHLLAYVDKLIETHGSAAVLAFR